MSSLNKKSMKFIIAILLSIVLVGACNNKVHKESKTSKGSNDGEYGFVVFNMDIDTKDAQNSISVKYDDDGKQIMATYKNKDKDIDLHGDAAMEKLHPIFKDLSFTHKTDDDEVIKKISKEFGVKDYERFDLELKFKDHYLKEYRIKKQVEMR